MVESAIKPKRPKGSGWTQMVPPPIRSGYPVTAWRHKDRIIVLSAVEVADDLDTNRIGPEYHISVSLQGGRRIDSAGAKWVKRQFGMSKATEDNHVPHGICRNFWMPVDEKLVGIECPCVDEEPASAEDKGDYIWRGQKK